jgi:diguanylate cyclase (GGDEF)-like protein
MPKRDAAKNRRVKAQALPLRRQASRASEPPAPARPQRRSVAMRLAEEVNRLELELATAHTRMATLEQRAEIDPLTDLVNRRGLERELKRALAYVKRYGASAALVYVDLNQFKVINDRHGHAAGDAVLKAVAMVLSRQLRESDLAARLGGDEFALLLWNLDPVQADAKARSLEAAVGRMTATHADALLSVGASAGSTQLLPLDSVSGALDRADRAMYARKSGPEPSSQTENAPDPPPRSVSNG